MNVQAVLTKIIIRLKLPCYKHFPFYIIPKIDTQLWSECIITKTKPVVDENAGWEEAWIVGKVLLLILHYQSDDVSLWHVQYSIWLTWISDTETGLYCIIYLTTWRFLGWVVFISTSCIIIIYFFIPPALKSLNYYYFLFIWHRK